MVVFAPVARSPAVVEVPPVLAGGIVSCMGGVVMFCDDDDGLELQMTGVRSCHCLTLVVSEFVSRAYAKQT